MPERNIPKQLIIVIVALATGVGVNIALHEFLPAEQLWLHLSLSLIIGGVTGYLLSLLVKDSNKSM